MVNFRSGKVAAVMFAAWLGGGHAVTALWDASLVLGAPESALAQEAGAEVEKPPEGAAEERPEEVKRKRRTINIEEELTEDERKLLKAQESESQTPPEEQLPFEVPSDPNLLPEYAMVVTNKGKFEIKLFRHNTPVSVANFKHLVEKGLYEGVPFHRYVPGFVIQGGDPTGTEKGGPGWTLPPEMDPDVHHIRGTIGWARLSGKLNPERRSNGSQFYICLQPQPRLDGFYTAFAVVEKGMETVDRLRPGDQILKIQFPREYRMAHPAKGKKEKK